MRWLRARQVALVALVALASVAGAGGEAAARSEKTLAYPRDQAWPAAVRFLAVDERLKLVEKDEGAGYVLFELRDEGKLFRGSLEVVVIAAPGRTLVRFVLTIEDRPSWLEAVMLGRLERKLRAELGAPAPAPSPRPRDGAPKDGAPKDAPKAGPKAPAPPPDDGGPPISPTP
jgi:hypothetical protein